MGLAGTDVIHVGGVLSSLVTQNTVKSGPGLKQAPIGGLAALDLGADTLSQLGQLLLIGSQRQVV